MTAVSVASVWKYYGDFPALRDVTLEIAQGSCLALLGRNGAGKTTLLKILAGLSRPGRGSVRLLGEEARAQKNRLRIGVLGHGIGVYEELSALENLRLFARLYNVPDSERVVSNWLSRAGLGHVRDGLVREFSRGMRQRLAVARALLHDPALLLLDEPFTALDDRGIDVLQSALAEARQRGTTIVMSTHQLREAMQLATDVALMDRGRLAWHGPRNEEMLNDPTLVYRVCG